MASVRTSGRSEQRLARGKSISCQPCSDGETKGEAVSCAGFDDILDTLEQLNLHDARS